MSVERITLIKRTIWVSECECGDRAVRTDRGPRERLCPACKTWVPFVKLSFTGPDIGSGGMS